MAANLAAILDHLDKVSVFGPSAVALFLILGLDWVFTGIHTYQEWRGEAAPLWRVFGAVVGLRLPNWLGFLLFTVTLTLALWIVGLAGIAGALSGNMLGTDPGMADSLGAILMIVIVVGGLGSLSGAFFASLLIGVLQTLAASSSLAWADMLTPVHGLFSSATLETLGQPISRFAPLVPFAIVIVVLAVRPRGLMGTRHQ